MLAVVKICVAICTTDSYFLTRVRYSTCLVLECNAYQGLRR